MRKAQSHRNIGTAHQFRAIRTFPLRDNVCREIEVAFVSADVVKFHDRFKY